VQKDGQACNLNREDATDGSRWKNQAHPGSPGQRAVKRLLLLLSRQITMPVPPLTPLHSVFCRPDAIPAAQPTASKH